jgi:hypothetical protein
VSVPYDSSQQGEYLLSLWLSSFRPNLSEGIRRSRDTGFQQVKIRDPLPLVYPIAPPTERKVFIYSPLAGGQPGGGGGGGEQTTSDATTDSMTEDVSTGAGSSGMESSEADATSYPVTTSLVDPGTNPYTVASSGSIIVPGTISGPEVSLTATWSSSSWQFQSTGESSSGYGSTGSESMVGSSGQSSSNQWDSLITDPDESLLPGLTSEVPDTIGPSLCPSCPGARWVGPVGAGCAATFGSAPLCGTRGVGGKPIAFCELDENNQYTGADDAAYSYACCYDNGDGTLFSVEYTGSCKEAFP